MFWIISSDCRSQAVAFFLFGLAKMSSTCREGNIEAKRESTSGLKARCGLLSVPRHRWPSSIDRPPSSWNQQKFNHLNSETHFGQCPNKRKKHLTRIRDVKYFSYFDDVKENPTCLRACCGYSKAEFDFEVWRCDTLGRDFRCRIKTPTCFSTSAPRPLVPSCSRSERTGMYMLDFPSHCRS